ncbi:hypothetical protein E2C01_018233 [Portunus trituberculatus]|uniref:Uncharacterized protein n=1 Tax=Portunus trituberculatus TaxID=210409 RepID=A0A5B7DVV5_PORTR|nr:hypothetical protein [Portunus trituberculatus]
MSWQVPHLSGFGKLRSLRYTMSLSQSLGRYTLPVFVESTIHICGSIRASQISFYLYKLEVKQVINSTAQQNRTLSLLETLHGCDVGVPLIELDKVDSSKELLQM